MTMGLRHLFATRPGLCFAAVLLVCAVQGASAQPATEPLRLAKIFSDGLVVQRGAPIPVWGWAPPRAAVSATFAGRTARAVADATGQWRLGFPAAAAGGPHALTVESSGRTLQVRDVLVGDVWLASGQSNMEWPLSQTTNAGVDVAAANDSMQREYKVPVSWSDTPREDLSGGRWMRADPQQAGGMSAVGYYFARELRRTQRVPIGIVNSSWGGSAIETWLAAQTQRLNSDSIVALMATEQRVMDSTLDALRTRLGTRGERDPGLVDGRAVWADPGLDDASWSAIQVPALWETQGYAGMDGIAWYRTTFALTADEASRGGILTLGPIDDDDITWVNGLEVGRTSGYNRPRTYRVAPAMLRAGRNVLAIRVADYAGGGGPYAQADSVRLQIIGAAARPLAGAWKFRVGEISVRADGQRVNKIPAVTYNAMIHPILRMPIRGVIWYQGESNANTAAQAIAYRDQFATLIQSWRASWASERVREIPFLWVQLPNFGRPDSVPPSTSAWALHRESMEAALALSATGQAITIDIGEADDIHPRNKRDVGQRLALVARRAAYREPVMSSGPTYKQYQIANGRVTIEFDHVGKGLTSRSADGRVGGFAIAGPDGKWVWAADARLDGDRVVVSSDRVPNPIAVRYAWGNNPHEATLYNRDGLPAAPFRTDRW
jgi:sialate O-acetylesterase